MRPTLVLTAALASLLAGAAAAQPMRSDQVKRDDFISRKTPPPAAPDQRTQGTTRLFVQTDDQGRTVANAPIPDTAVNRERYGQPLSRAGRRSAARGD